MYIIVSWSRPCYPEVSHHTWRRIQLGKVGCIPNKYLCRPEITRHRYYIVWLLVRRRFAMASGLLVTKSSQSSRDASLVENKSTSPSRLRIQRVRVAGTKPTRAEDPSCPSFSRVKWRGNTPQSVLCLTFTYWLPRVPSLD